MAKKAFLPFFPLCSVLPLILALFFAWKNRVSDGSFPAAFGGFRMIDSTSSKKSKRNLSKKSPNFFLKKPKCSLQIDLKRQKIVHAIDLQNEFSGVGSEK